MTKNPSEVKNEPTLDEIAEEILSRRDIITDIKSQIIYVYDCGIWKPEGEAVIKEICTELLRDKFTTTKYYNTLNYIQGKTYKPIIEPPTNFICLENGILDINIGILQDHSHDLFFPNKLSLRYDPEADCPKIKQFLSEIFYPEDIPVIQEFMGYCLYRNYPIAKSWIGVGDGANGKSTFLELVKTFLGKQNISSVSLQELSENRFAKYDLYGKLANICADLSNKALSETGIFKMLTGGDVITAEQKFKSRFQFVNYAKFLFSANRLPETKDDTDVFFRRWIITIFPNQFKKENGKEPKQKDKLINELTTQEDLSGLLIWALEGFKKLLANGDFTNSRSTEQLREEYSKKSSPIQAFVIECLEQSSYDFIVKKELYAVYCAFCRINHYPIFSEDTFHKKIPQVVNITEYKKDGKVRTWRGIKYSEKGLKLQTQLNQEQKDSKDTIDTLIPSLSYTGQSDKNKI